MNNFTNANQPNQQLFLKGIIHMKLQNLFFALFFACVLFFTTSPVQAQTETEAVPQPEHSRHDDRRDNSLKPTGAWQLLGNTKLQGDFKGLMTFGSDGTMLADEHGGAFETTGHGNWKRIGWRTFAYTFIAYIGSANSQLTAVIKVSGTLTLSRDQKSWNGPFKIDVLSPKGDKLFSDNGTFQGTRIKIEDIE